jgi:hypothetical protein
MFISQNGVNYVSMTLPRGPHSQHFIFFVTYESAQYATPFVCKVGAYPIEVRFNGSTLGGSGLTRKH